MGGMSDFCAKIHVEWDGSMWCVVVDGQVMGEFDTAIEAHRYAQHLKGGC